MSIFSSKIIWKMHGNDRCLQTNRKSRISRPTQSKLRKPRLTNKSMAPGNTSRVTTKPRPLPATCAIAIGPRNSATFAGAPRVKAASPSKSKSPAACSRALARAQSSCSTAFHKLSKPRHENTDTQQIIQLNKP